MGIDVKLSKNPAIRALVRAVYPSYKKRTARVVRRETWPLRDIGIDGTPRHTYVAVDIATKASLGPPTVPTRSPEQVGSISVDIQPGQVIVEGGPPDSPHSQACVYVHPSDFDSVINVGTG